MLQNWNIRQSFSACSEMNYHDFQGVLHWNLSDSLLPGPIQSLYSFRLYFKPLRNTAPDTLCFSLKISAEEVILEKDLDILENGTYFS